MAGPIAASAPKPFFLGKDPWAREKDWQDFRMYDRWWNHVPIYSYGPFDICLYDIAAKASGLPLCTNCSTLTETRCPPTRVPSY
jgi:L-alanine-DL-glutamate epimerase-like enolase superfamily enzyme